MISVDGQQITGPIKPSLETHWGRREAKQFFDFKHILHPSDFDPIWWEGMRNAIESYPKMFRIFITKQILGWCGSNSKQSLWDTTISNECPNCGLASKTSKKHLTCCSYRGRITLFQESTKDTIHCLEQANVDMALITIIKDYMLHQGLVSMESHTLPGSRYMVLARIQD